MRRRRRQTDGLLVISAGRCGEPAKAPSWEKKRSELVDAYHDSGVSSGVVVGGSGDAANCCGCSGGPHTGSEPKVKHRLLKSISGRSTECDGEDEDWETRSGRSASDEHRDEGDEDEDWETRSGMLASDEHRDGGDEDSD